MPDAVVTAEEQAPRYENAKGGGAPLCVEPSLLGSGGESMPDAVVKAAEQAPLHESAKGGGAPLCVEPSVLGSDVKSMPDAVVPAQAGPSPSGVRAEWRIKAP
ncbi:MAG: hypothetical protein J0L88_05140 [Xanthomonadales bacterium]|nr:hypothetical protein [Xanthomonadales bacterium]